MANINETTGSKPLEAAIDAGLKALSRDQHITFRKYNRAVLPFDGYVFWVRDVATNPVQVLGSLHYDTDQQQRADETIGINKVVFTTQVEVENFNLIAESVAWIGEIDNIRFSFTARGKKYEQAGTYHYRGDAIYPVMYPQIIDNPVMYGTLDGNFVLDASSLAPDGPTSNLINLGPIIATNSMPIWLGLNKYAQLFPAFMVDSNILPPYAAVDISDTRPLQAFPLVDANGTSNQLMTEKVKIIMHGLRHDAAIDFLNYVLDASLNMGTFGIQNMPGIVDEKRGQSELGILAQKKVIEFEINYYQTRVQQVSRQLILNAGISFAPDPFQLLDSGFILDQSQLAPGGQVFKSGALNLDFILDQSLVAPP